MSLAERLKHLIQTDGPMPLSTWMTLCLHDPEEGYYATRPGLGRDFRTAPETSQVFGELLGLWAVHEWQVMGMPSPVTLAELGPGKGTLMKDALRATRGAAEFRKAMDLILVEVSPALRAVQAEALSEAAPRHMDDLADLPDQPAIILANEFLDCLPARHFIKTGEAWHERVVGLNEAGEFSFGLAVDRAPDGLSALASGAVDIQPGLEAIVETLAARTAPFRALFIDYGPADTAPSDTLRAFREGEQVDPLSTPGMADLTLDVDFGRLKRLAKAAGLEVAGPTAQGALLGQLGVEARMQQLIRANPGKAEEIHAGVAELVEPAKMGLRFKALCLSSPGLPEPVGF
ncbi:MAG: SAM-dependent methyltransferase [Hyphomonadaceae bacterium]|nr:SAM-dependent methyltransferase [Hyphomonadaceae bacterium]